MFFLCSLMPGSLTKEKLFQKAEKNKNNEKMYIFVRYTVIIHR